jgi:dienelactone hydrolase
LAAKGYIVITPAIPLLDEMPDVIDSVMNAVLPAIDAAADAGIIDESDIHAFGVSWGGWAVLALLADAYFDIIAPRTMLPP